MSFMDPPERHLATKKGPIAAEGPELRTEQNGPIRQMPPGGWGADEIRRRDESGHRGNGNNLHSPWG